MCVFCRCPFLFLGPAKAVVFMVVFFQTYKVLLNNTHPLLFSQVDASRFWLVPHGFVEGKMSGSGIRRRKIVFQGPVIPGPLVFCLEPGVSRVRIQIRRAEEVWCLYPVIFCLAEMTHTIPVEPPGFIRSVDLRLEAVRMGRKLRVRNQPSTQTQV